MGEGDWEAQGGAEGGETVIRLYCMKKTFSIKKKRSPNAVERRQKNPHMVSKRVEMESWVGKGGNMGFVCRRELGLSLCHSTQ